MLLEGIVLRRGENLRLSVELIEGANGLSRWQSTYDLQSMDLLAIQQSIAEQIVGQILNETSSLDETQATRSESANEHMLLARYYEQQVRELPTVDEATLLQAISRYRQATIADPNSALAHARLANVLMYSGNFIDAEAPIFRALSLNPQISEVQKNKGLCPQGH